jgi:fumarate reductase (CoM/CoB) subunit B
MRAIDDSCLECGQCAESCPLLAELGQSPLQLARQGVDVMAAFSCSLCGACETACPQGLSPGNLFAARRYEAVEHGEVDMADYRYLFPDRTNNIMNTYRRQFGIDYQDVKGQAGAGTWFFPGCTLLTYSPQLTRAVFCRLQESLDCGGLWTGCCGKPLQQLGLKRRHDSMRESLQRFRQAHKIDRLITACPGCYYELQEVFKESELIIQTVYEALDFTRRELADKRICTIHDSCPDRFTGNFGSQVRQALQQCGFTLVEMKHNKEKAICCGSGGQISHFPPDFTEQLVQVRLAEVRESAAEILVGYCLSCVLKFDNHGSSIPVTHALNLLLNESEDYRGARDRVVRMLSGIDGEKIWREIMSD